MNGGALSGLFGLDLAVALLDLDLFEVLKRLRFGFGSAADSCYFCFSL